MASLLFKDAVKVVPIRAKPDYADVVLFLPNGERLGAPIEFGETDVMEQVAEQLNQFFEAWAPVARKEPAAPAAPPATTPKMVGRHERPNPIKRRGRGQKKRKRVAA